MPDVRISRFSLLGSTALRGSIGDIRFPGTAHGVTSGSVVDLQVSELTKVLDKMHAKLSTIRSSQNFTPTGKGEQSATVGKTAVGEIEALVSKQRKLPAGHLEAAAKTITSLKMSNWQDAMKNRGYSMDGAQSRLSEIRKFLSGLDPATANAMILEAARNGDNEAILAIRQAPSILRSKFPTDTILEKATTHYIEAKHPAEHSAHEDAVNLLGFYDANTKTALRNIMDSAGFGSQTDPLAEQAAAGETAE